MYVGGSSADAHSKRFEVFTRWSFDAFWTRDVFYMQVAPHRSGTLRSTVTISAAAAALRWRRTSNTKPSARLPDAGTRASRSAALL